MGYVFNGDTKIIDITSPTTAFDADELYSRWKEWAQTEANSHWAQAMYSTGGDPLGGGKTIAGYIIMINGWKLKPYDGDYTLIVNGNLVGDGGVFPFVPADSGSVNIALQVTGNAIAVIQTGGSALTTEENARLMAIPTETLTVAENAKLMGLSDGEGLTTEEKAKLMAIPTAAETAEEVWTYERAGVELLGDLEMLSDLEMT